MILVQEHILKTMKPYKNLHIHYRLINDLHLPNEYYPHMRVQIILKKWQAIFLFHLCTSERAYAAAPPFSQKITLGTPVRLRRLLSRLRSSRQLAAATNFLRSARVPIPLPNTLK